MFFGQFVTYSTEEVIQRIGYFFFICDNFLFNRLILVFSRAFLGFITLLLHCRTTGGVATVYDTCQCEIQLVTVIGRVVSIKAFGMDKLLENLPN